MDRSNLKRKSTAAAPAPAKKTRAITSFFAPAPTTASKAAPGVVDEDSPLPPSKAEKEKEKWVATLTPEQKELLQLEIDTMHATWLVALKDELVTERFLALKRFLAGERGPVYPPAGEIYAWTRCR